MELHEWKREHRKNMQVNPIIFDFLDEHPWLFHRLDNIEWTNIGLTLNILPKNKEIKQHTFKLFSHTLMTMDCLKEQQRLSKALIFFLRGALSIKPTKTHPITREDLTDLRIALNTSQDVNDFLDEL